MNRRWEVGIAIALGVVTHAVFAVSVTVMFIGLYSGLRTGHGHLHGWHAAVVDALLILQFPILHSFLLSKPGRALLARAAPGGLGVALTTTTYALVASLQLLAVFWLWSFSGITFYDATGPFFWFSLVIYLASWLFLIKALTDAGLGLQTGFKGWSAVARGKRPTYGDFPTHGLFRICRHPVYLGFALVLWTAPVMTPDGLLLAGIWTLYCAIGPRLKEARYRKLYDGRYQRYCEALPYILPSSRRLPIDWAQQNR